LSTDKRKKVRAPAPPATEQLPPPVTAIDRIIVEIRMFIAASIFFNSRAAEKAGLGLTDMQMLNLLQVYGPSTPGFLGSRSGLSSGGVTVALDRLEKAGFVRREPNPADRRSLLVAFVPSKLRKLEGMYEAVEHESRQKIGSLPQRDLEAVLRFFEAMHTIETSPTRQGKPQSN
jgi:MarR family transcriptional regulator, organic hydroperoxide resistance regulator